MPYTGEIQGKAPRNRLTRRISSYGGRFDAPEAKPARADGDENSLIWNNLKLSTEIPREVREDIYSYLKLSPESAKYTPTADRPPKLGKTVKGVVRGPHSSAYCNGYKSGTWTAHTYNFNITMLLLNKATKADVEEYILRMNKFVLVEYWVPLMNDTLNHCNVPVVADQHLDTCQVNSVRLRLDWRSPPSIRVHGLTLEETLKAEYGRVLLTWDDFPKLCRMLKFMCQYSDPCAVYIISERNNHLWTSTGGYTRHDAPSMSFTIVRQLNSGKQIEFVKNILTIMGAGYNIGLWGVSDDRGTSVFSYMTSMMETTGPYLVWAKAVFWERLHTAFELKREADKLAENGQTPAAYVRFTSIFAYFAYESELDLHDYFQMWHAESESDAMRKILHKSWYGLRTDLCFSIVATDIIRTHASTVLAPASAARTTLMWLRDNPARALSISDHELAQRLHLRALVFLTYYRDLVLSQLLVADPIREFLESVGEGPEFSTPRSKADYDTIRDLQQKLQQDQNDDPLGKDVLVQMCIIRDGFQTFNWCSPVNIPSELKHWQDRTHLRSFSDYDKSVIIRQQDMLRIPNTEF